jgi:hypothetical protein
MLKNASGEDPTPAVNRDSKGKERADLNPSSWMNKS